MTRKKLSPTQQLRLQIPSGSPSPYRSPVLTALEPTIVLAPEPACATCPAGAWYHSPSDINCFCSIYRTITWDGRMDPLISCDAREQALAKLLPTAGEKLLAG